MPIVRLPFGSLYLEWFLHLPGPQGPVGSTAVGYGRELLSVNTVQGGLRLMMIHVNS